MRLWGWERVEVHGGRGPAARERLEHYCRMRGVEGGVWGRRGKKAFWLSVMPGGRRIFRPVLRGRLVETANAVAIRGRIRPIAWSGWVLLVGPAMTLAALVPRAGAGFALVGLAFTLLMGGLAWLEHADYKEDARSLRATADAIVGASATPRALR